MNNTKLSSKKEENKNIIVYSVAGFGLLYLLTRKSSALPSIKYSCTGSPDYSCIEDINGVYSSIEECKLACTLGSQLIDVIINE